MMGNSTIWLSPTDFVTGDTTLQISQPSVSHPNTTMTCTSPGDMKWISMNLALPEKSTVEEIIVCYQVSNPISFIYQIRLSEIKTPEMAIVRHDDATDLKNTEPDCYVSKIDGGVINILSFSEMTFTKI